MRSPRGIGATGRVLLAGYEAVGLGAAALFASVATLGAMAGSESSRRLRERIGRYDGRPLATGDVPVVWLHAASVGEVRVAEPLLSALRARLADASFVLTCQTATGLALASSLALDERRYFPIDCRFAVRRAIAHFRPSLFVFVETEIWPRLLLELAAAGVPSVMAGARVSATSFRRYRRLRALFGPALATLAHVCARDDDSYRRLVDLGAPAARSSVSGDIKLDALDRGAVAETPDALAGRAEGARVLFAVSTHEGEEALVLDAFARVRRAHANACLVLAPRHPRRADEVATLAASHGRVARWSRDPGPRGWDVLVVDTTGDARTFFPSAECVFVGGSVADVGGHNLAEPAAFAVPCAVGPRLEGVRHQADLLERAGALVVVEDAESLARVWSGWLREPREAERIGGVARNVIEASGGAVARTLAALEPLLERIHRGASA